LRIPAGHSLPSGTEIKIEHGEITHAVGGDTYDTYCHVNPDGAINDASLRV
jgi:hypothetical protein